MVHQSVHVQRLTFWCLIKKLSYLTKAFYHSVCVWVSLRVFIFSSTDSLWMELSLHLHESASFNLKMKQLSGPLEGRLLHDTLSQNSPFTEGHVNSWAVCRDVNVFIPKHWTSACWRKAASWSWSVFNMHIEVPASRSALVMYPISLVHAVLVHSWSTNSQKLKVFFRDISHHFNKT